VFVARVLVIFIKHLKKKRPLLVEQEWFFSVHTTAIVQDWQTAFSVQVVCHMSHAPDLVLEDFISY
jgi:hypothetical protein